jgi:hypothetical protein
LYKFHHDELRGEGHIAVRMRKRMMKKKKKKKKKKRRRRNSTRTICF